MINPIQIAFRGMSTSKALTAKIRRRADKLDRYHDGIVSCRVVIEQLHQRHQQGNLFHVRIEVGVPGAELVVGREHHDNHRGEDPWVAVNDAFDKMDRQLEDYGRKQNNRSKTHAVPLHGTVTMVNPDHGFIRTPDDREVYFHGNSVVEGYDRVESGTQVRFDLHEGEGLDGPQASTVHPIGKHHLPDTEVS
jgi:ribosomal subunit interface protein